MHYLQVEASNQQASINRKRPDQSKIYVHEQLRSRKYIYSTNSTVKTVVVV